jgi:hypothetical protein
VKLVEVKVDLDRQINNILFILIMIIQLVKILGISVIHILILFAIAPMIDHAFSPLNKDESNAEILFEIITQLLTVAITWYLLEKYVLHTINKYFKLHNVKMVDTIVEIISALVMIGLQTHLISKLEYITHEHPFRVFQIED